MGVYRKTARMWQRNFSEGGWKPEVHFLALNIQRWIHLARTSKKRQGEYDIVLHNGEYAIIIEVKYKLHPFQTAFS